MKVNELFEDRYFDQWAKEKAAQNKAKLKARKAAERDDKKIHDRAVKAYQKSLKPKKPSDLELWQKVETAISNSFPDGDPIDHLPRGVDMDDIDRAVAKFAGSRGKGKKKYGLYDYLADMWDDFQGDAVHDANEDLKRGNAPREHSVFFHYDDEANKIVKERNPWR
mgnify:CR=1 FL=1